MIDMKTLKEGLFELSDRDFQIKAWAIGIDGEIHSYEEAMCYVYSDSSVNFYFDKGELGSYLPKEVCDKLIELGKASKPIPNNHFSNGCY